MKENQIVPPGFTSKAETPHLFYDFYQLGKMICMHARELCMIYFTSIYVNLLYDIQ